MATLFAHFPNTTAFRGIAAFRTGKDQILRKWQRARAQRETVFRITQELANCTDRQLADLGMSRSDIPAVARGTYRCE